MNISYKKCVESDALELKEFCKPDAKALGYPYKKLILEFIENGAWWILVDNEKAGCISFSYKRRKPKPEIRIENLFVTPKYRKKKLALHLIKHLYENTLLNNTTNILISDVKNTNFVAECWDGFLNNSFYDKISSKYDLVERKVFCNLRRYYIDINLVNNLLADS